MAQPPERLVVMGRIGVPFGVKGWIKVHPFTETPGALLSYPVWWLSGQGEWSEVRPVEAEVRGASVVVRLPGVETREQAAALRNREIAVPRAEFPQTADDEFYWSDLEGMRVTTSGGEPLGVVSGLMDIGVHDVLVVEGDRERLIPFVARHVVAVDRDAREITVDWDADY